MPTTTKYTERRFLGVLPENPTKKQIRFHQKHERAYLKGYERFIFGYIQNSLGIRVPVWHNVKQEVIIDEEKRQKLKRKRNG